MNNMPKELFSLHECHFARRGMWNVVASFDDPDFEKNKIGVKHVSQDENPRVKSAVKGLFLVFGFLVLTKTVTQTKIWKVFVLHFRPHRDDQGAV